MNLLYPMGKDNIKEISEDTYRNLAIEELVEMIAVTAEDKTLVRKVFAGLVCDRETSCYRQEIIKTFLAQKNCAKI